MISPRLTWLALLCILPARRVETGLRFLAITPLNCTVTPALVSVMPTIRPTRRRSICHACVGVGCDTERSEAMADKRNACAVVGQTPAGCEGETPLASACAGVG